MYSAEVDARNNRVIVETTRITPALRRALKDRYGDAVVLRHGERPAEDIARHEDTAPVWGGARIGIKISRPAEGGTGCTSGFVYAIDRRRYYLTAGHCIPPGTNRRLRRRARGDLLPADEPGRRGACPPRAGPDGRADGAVLALTRRAVEPVDSEPLRWEGDA